MEIKHLFLRRIAPFFICLTLYGSCFATEESDINTSLQCGHGRVASVTTSSSYVPLVSTQDGTRAHEKVRPKHPKTLNLVFPSVFPGGEEVPLMRRLPRGLMPDEDEKNSNVVQDERSGSALVLPYVPPLQLSQSPSDPSASLSPRLSSGASSPISPIGLSSKRLMSFEELSYLIAVRNMCVSEFSDNILEDIKRHQSILIRGSADRREQEFSVFCRSPFLEFYQEARHNKRLLLTQHVQSLFPVFLYVVKGAVDFIENYEQKIIKHRSADKPISALGLETSVSLIGDIHKFFCTHGSRMSHFYTVILNVASESDRDIFETKAHEHTQELSHTGAVISLAFIQRFYLEAPGYLYSLKAAYANCCPKTPFSQEQEAVPILSSVTSPRMPASSSPRMRASSSPRGKLVSVVVPKDNSEPSLRKGAVRVKSFRTTPRTIKEDQISDSSSSVMEESNQSINFSLETSSSSRFSGDDGERDICVTEGERIVGMREFLSTTAPTPALEPVSLPEGKTSQTRKKTHFFGRHFKGK